MFETTKNTKYLEDTLELLKVVEGFRKLPYNDKAKEDDSGYLTIGYGINLQERNWLIAVLNELGLFGSVKDLKTKEDIEALDNKANKAKIDEFYNITKQIVTNDNISTIRTQLNDLLKKYTGQSSFKLNKEQAIKIKKIASDSIFDYTSRINDKTLKMDKETNEYAGILSYAFNVGNDSRKYFFDICNKDKDNRFLSFFTLRYGVNFLLNNDNAKFGIAKRRFWESQLFGFEYNGNNAFKTAIGIFKILNFKYKPRFILKNYNDNFIKNFKESLNQTYLDWIVNYEDKLLYAKKDKNQTWQEFYNADAKTNNLTENFSNIQGITPDKDNILSPYLDYLNTLTQKTFSLENIYCIQSFYGVLGAHKLDNVASINKILSQRFSNNSKQPQPTTQDSTAQANPAQSTNENPTQILILYPKATPLPIQIIQPENTFLTLVVGKNAKLDCSKLLLDKCEIHYLQYDENQEESTENPKITALKTDSELTLTTKDSNLYEVIHNGIIYYISKNEGVLRVALGQNREEVIELYNFAKENKYKILKESHSQILDIQLKLQDNKELPTSHNGNFALTINNLTLLDKNGKNLDIAEDYTLYLHNCENRIIYENTSIQKNTDDTYRVNFSFDLIQDEDSNFFKRTTKLIIATQNLSNDFSTSEIHTKGNVAVVSLSSADKKGGNYTFTKKVSAQEFESQIINARKEYLASLDSLAYEGSREKDWFVILKDELYLIEAEVAFFAKEAFQNAYVRESYNKSIKEMSNQLLKEVEKEQDIHKRKILAKQLAQDANKFRNEIMNDMRAKSTTWGRVRAERIKSRGKTFEEMIEKKIKDLSYNKPFEQLTKQEQTKVFEEIIKSSGKSNEKVNAKISMVKNFARGIIVFSIGYLIYDLYVSENKARVIISHSATIGGGFVGGGLGVGGGGYLGDKIVNEWFDDEINVLLKEYNLD
ncbi:hypothetical protein [Helicobacter fennelliae]|uniref:Uncharacterized protein n=1 Tax=Helicobacter fennelliae MRY12-0050 TaxID=1325130 RepID=T1D4T2_9HELI|nr:hypothetical protein [Helicobacter fennelliae]GAD20191.1 hypothetical protein HFN_1435 [Helicobacter fennelliae MRY12-0050]STP07312.1 Uncharacterised protein [Helicobacter fennelliae]